MCNPTDNLVRYPLPYKVVDGCLCQETTKRNKPTTEKLCNFTAYIVNEVLFDDGVGTSRTMRIGGVQWTGCLSVGALIVSLSLCREQLKEFALPFRAQPPSRTPRTCTTRQDGRTLTVNGITFFRVQANMMYGCSESSAAMKWQRTGQNPICKRYG